MQDQPYRARLGSNEGGKSAFSTVPPTNKSLTPSDTSSPPADPLTPDSEDTPCPEQEQNGVALTEEEEENTLLNPNATQWAKSEVCWLPWLQQSQIPQMIGTITTQAYT